MIVLASMAKSKTAAKFQDDRQKTKSVKITNKTNKLVRELVIIIMHNKFGKDT